MPLIPAAFCLVCVLPVAALADETRAVSEKKRVKSDGYTLRLSLPTEEDHAQWRTPGLRIALGYGYGRYLPTRAPTGFAAHHLMLRPEFRIDDEWSIAATCTYSVAVGSVVGLRWSVSLDPTWHPVAGLAVSLGMGYAGFMGERPYRTVVGDDGELYYEPPSDDPVTPALSRNANRREVLRTCVGSGWNTLARVEYLFVAGPLFASGPFMQGDWQWTACEQATGGTDPNTGRMVVITQWWGHHGVSLGWWLAWR